MTIAPPRKKSTAVFWIATILIGSSILATVLLANDGRNLKALAQYYHLSWFDPPLPPPTAAKPVVALKARLKPAQIQLSEHMLDEGLPAMEASFVRTWKISGEALCARLIEAGFPVGAWKQSGIDTGTFECSYETQDSKGPDAASFFVIVRGTATGEVSNVRLKVILPDTDAGRAFRDKFTGVVAMLVKESQWPDFETTLEPIGRLENVTRTAFGAKLTFSHEFEDPRRFNFVFELERATPQQRRTGNVLDSARWLPSPISTAAN